MRSRQLTDHKMRQEPNSAFISWHFSFSHSALGGTGSLNLCERSEFEAQTAEVGDRSLIAVGGVLRRFRNWKVCDGCLKFISG